MAAAAQRRTRWRWAAAALVVLLWLAYSLGPHNSLGPDQPTARPSPPEAAQLDAWLAQQEAAYPDIRAGLQRQVVWHGRAGQRTPWAVVYVHGFGASKLETAPLAEQIAQTLGANLYHTRLVGHGRSAQAMGEARAQDWLADTVQAVEVGQRIGQRVLLIGTSTGATLATWLGLGSQGSAVDAYVLISPNYGPKNKLAELINLPWGMQLAQVLEGPMRGRASERDIENHAWTKVYPTRALFPMMALVEHVRQSDLSAFAAPVLVLYAKGDKVVDASQTEAVFARLGSTQKTLRVVDYSDAADQHVLAGSIRAPQATARVRDEVLGWLQGHFDQAALGQWVAFERE